MNEAFKEIYESIHLEEKSKKYSVSVTFDSAEKAQAFEKWCLENTDGDVASDCKKKSFKVKRNFNGF